MTRESLDELIVGKRLPLFVVEMLKANNVERLFELTNRTELTNAIEIELNPIQVSKFRRLILEDAKRGSHDVAERDEVLIQSELAATRCELEVQLVSEKAALEYINALLLDDDARLSLGAKRKLEHSKSMHQSRANRLKTLLNQLPQTSNPAAANGGKIKLRMVHLHKAKQKKVQMNLRWRYPEVEEETRPSIEGYAARFNKHFSALYERICCPTGCLRNRAHEEAPGEAEAMPVEVKPCNTEKTSECSHSDLPAALLQPFLHHPLQVQCHWHDQLVFSLASLCAAVRDCNQRDETLHLEAAYLRTETAASMRLGKHGCWNVYFHVRKSLHQRYDELWAARRRQHDLVDSLFDQVRTWNHNAMEYNLYLRSNSGLDQTRYLTRAGLHTVRLAEQMKLPHSEELNSHVLDSYLTVRVAHPECDLVGPQDNSSFSYHMLVRTALTSM